MCAGFYAVDLSFEKRRPDGLTLAYVTDQNLRICLSEVCAKIVPGEPDSFRNMLKCYLSGFLRTKFALVAVAESEGHTIGQERVLYLRRNPMNKILMPFCSEQGFSIRESPRNIEYVKYFFRPLYYLVVLLVSQLLREKVKSNISVLRSSVWIEYAHEFLDFTFWRGRTGAENFDIVYYLDRPDTPPSGEITDTIESKGIKWVDAHFIPLSKTINLDLKVIQRLLKYLFSADLSKPMWYRVFEFENSFWFFFYRTVFERFMVKILIQHQDTSWKQEIQAKAVEAVGGIMVGFHWSNYPCIMTPQHLFPFHVFFVWGKSIADMVKKGDHSCNHIIPSGVWLMAEEQKAEQYCVLSGELNFILAVFDSSTGYNAHQTPKTLSQFYLRLLVLLEKNQNWGVIVKSKDLDSLKTLPEGEMIIHRLSALVTGGRAVMLGKAVSPLIAADKAHLSACYGMNSAGIVSGTYGHRAVLWDCCGFLKHPFYEDPDQKIIFSTLDSLEQAINNAAHGDTAIGDFSGWRKAFNYFDDFEAPERIRQFIQAFMDDVSVTNNAQLSLDKAVQQYINKNNVAEDFFKEGHWWDNENFLRGSA